MLYILKYLITEMGKGKFNIKYQKLVKCSSFLFVFPLLCALNVIAMSGIAILYPTYFIHNQYQNTKHLKSSRMSGTQQMIVEFMIFPSFAIFMFKYFFDEYFNEIYVLS